MFPIKSSCFVGIFLLATSAVLTHCALQSSDPFSDIPVEEKSDDSAPTLQKRPSFFVGSRYGRSGGGGASSNMFSTSKTRRLNVVPRNDRFFLGSRYGKRTSEYMSPYEQNLIGDSTAFHASSSASGGSSLTAAAAAGADSNKSATPHMMSCVYTGLKNLYRCSSIEEINNIINQLTIAHDVDNEEQ